MLPRRPTVWQSWPCGILALEDPVLNVKVVLDTPAWVAWLEDPATTSFAFPVDNPVRGYIEGFMTVRKERRERGGVYWTAYWRVRGRLRKVYLGAPTAVTAARLQAIGAAWLAQTLAPRHAEGGRPDAPRIEGARLATETSGAGRAKPCRSTEGR